MDKEHIVFYESVDRERIYSIENDPIRHPFYKILTEFIQQHKFTHGKRCLEIGSSKGLFQDLVEDYTGVDVTEQLQKYYHKRFVVVDSALLPFPDFSFDAIWAYATHEHIPDIELSMQEIVRVLKPGGVCLFAPAWHTRPWFAQGYQMRSYSELSLKGKFIKLSIPLRDFILIRWPYVLLRRLLRLIQYLFFQSKPISLKYKRLPANYEKYWQSDSDACNSIDPFDVILWFRSRGFIIHQYNGFLKALFFRAKALELQKYYL